MDLMQIRRNMMGVIASQSGGGLPVEYTELKYIEANGNQFINTDAYMSDMTDIVKAIFACTQGTSGDDATIMAGTTGKWANGIGSLTRSSPYTQKPLTVYVGAQPVQQAYLMNINTFYEVTVNPNTNIYTVNGTDYAVQNRWDRYTPALSAYQIFNYNNKASITTKMKLKYAEVANKGIFIPCMRKSDNAVGVYNKVTNTFLSNNGVGTFGYETMDGTYVSPVTT